MEVSKTHTFYGVSEHAGFSLLFPHSQIADLSSRLFCFARRDVFAVACPDRCRRVIPPAEASCCSHASQAQSGTGHPKVLQLEIFRVIFLLPSKANPRTNGRLCLRAKIVCSKGHGRWQRQEHHHTHPTSTHELHQNRDHDIDLGSSSLSVFYLCLWPCRVRQLFPAEGGEWLSCSVSCHVWDAARLPCSPSLPRGRHPCPQASPAQSPWLALHFVQGLSSSHCLLLLLFHFRPLSAVQWTPANGKPGTEGRASCPGSASNHCGDAECASSASLAWHRPNSRGLVPRIKQTTLETERKLALCSKTPGISDLLTVHGAYTKARTGAAAWHMELWGLVRVYIIIT